MEGKLILDGSGSGAWNMALDEAFLQSASSDRAWTLRFYQWAEPTLSLGYFQQWSDRHLHVSSTERDCVRRSTGGGAILHHHDITYSLTGPNSDRMSAENENLYYAAHESIQSALANQSVQVSLHRTDNYSDQDPNLPKSIPQAQPFLCFLRRAKGDVILENRKVCGSAQRRWKNGLLQHGSIILETSEYAPEIEGVAGLSGIRLDLGQFISDCLYQMKRKIGVNFSESEASQAELDSAEEILLKKYGFSGWNRRR